MSEVRREMAALDDTLEKMTIYADQLGEATTEAISQFKGKVDRLFRPLISEVYATIGREVIRKEQHLADGPSTSKTGSRLPAFRKPKETKSEGTGSKEGDGDPKEGEHPKETKCSMSTENVCQSHPVTRRLLVNLTANGQVFVKHEPICGSDPRKVMSKEEWEEMVDFLVFWNALDTGDEKKLEEELKDLDEKFPMGQALSEGTEERDKKFLQLEKTRRSSKSKGNTRKTAKDNKKTKTGKEKDDKQEEEKRAMEVQRRERHLEQVARQELAEKLAIMHEEGFEKGLAKGENECLKQLNLTSEPKDRDGLLDGFYENIELATDEQLKVIVANARNFIEEATEEHVWCAKYRASLREITEQQMKEQGFEDGYNRGKIASKDKLRGIAGDLDAMMDDVYKTISIMERTGATKREVKDLMTNIKNYMDRRITIHLALDRAAENPGGHTCRQAIKAEPQETESEGSDCEENEEQSSSESNDEPMEGCGRQ